MKPLLAPMLALLGLVTVPTWAYTVNITAAAKAVYLQVGVGTMTGGTFSAGGVPGNNAAINSASVTVTGANVGNSVAQTMTTDSAVTASAWDGFAFCNANQVYIAGFNRRPTATASSAVLTVSAPASLVNATGDNIPFSQVQWVSSGNGDATPTMASGSFVAGGSLNLYTFPTNQWAESCMTFSYKNAAIVASGLYTGRVTYTLMTP